MKTIEPRIKTYIHRTVDIAVNKASSKFEKIMLHEIGLLQEFWRHEFALAMEIIKDKPGREEVREIARDELRYHGFQR